MLSDAETSAILAAATGGDAYAWARLMAVLAEREVTDLDADAIFEVVRAAAAPNLPAEVAALRALDAAGALVRAQLAFSDESARAFERRFGDARQLLATRCAQAGYDVTNPVVAAQRSSSPTDVVAATRTGCGLAVAAVIGVVAILGVVAWFVTRSVSTTVETVSRPVSEPVTGDGFSVTIIQQEMSDVLESFNLPALAQYDLPLHQVGAPEPTTWRAVVEPGAFCRYATGGPDDAEPLDQGTISLPTDPQTVEVEIVAPVNLYAVGCDFAVVP
ncbi:MAG: hypothetical protein HYU28_01120 [Actinobacteria bacterium]|nr:hypothetical protein [Actinomycetota bacterium]